MLTRSAGGFCRAAGSFGPAYGAYMAFTLVYATLATVPVTCIAQGGLADGGGISELKVRSAAGAYAIAAAPAAPAGAAAAAVSARATAAWAEASCSTMLQCVVWSSRCLAAETA
jgi:hypothetical protein